MKVSVTVGAEFEFWKAPHGIDIEKRKGGITSYKKELEIEKKLRIANDLGLPKEDVAVLPPEPYLCKIKKMVDGKEIPFMSVVFDDNDKCDQLEFISDVYVDKDKGYMGVSRTMILSSLQRIFLMWLWPFQSFQTQLASRRRRFWTHKGYLFLNFQLTP